jgi:hypothetical protein
MISDFQDIEPVPADHPHLADDPLYQAMSPAEKLGHRRMLARMWRLQREREEYRAQHPEDEPIEGRILAVLERIEEKLNRMRYWSETAFIKSINEWKCVATDGLPDPDMEGQDFLVKVASGEHYIASFERGRLRGFFKPLEGDFECDDVTYYAPLSRLQPKTQVLRSEAGDPGGRIAGEEVKEA